MIHQNRMSTAAWMPDEEMGHGYDMMVFDQGEDYSGKVRCTVVRKTARKPSARGILYVPTLTDYFFQKEMTEEFNRHGYDFYSVDLRRQGRSWRPGETKYELR